MVSRRVTPFRIFIAGAVQWACSGSVAPPDGTPADGVDAADSPSCLGALVAAYTVGPPMRAPGCLNTWARSVFTQHYWSNCEPNYGGFAGEFGTGGRITAEIVPSVGVAGDVRGGIILEPWGGTASPPGLEGLDCRDIGQQCMFIRRNECRFRVITPATAEGQVGEVELIEPCTLYPEPPLTPATVTVTRFRARMPLRVVVSTMQFPPPICPRDR